MFRSTFPDAADCSTRSVLLFTAYIIHILPSWVKLSAEPRPAKGWESASSEEP